MLTAANGSYKNTIIIREVDDTYIFIKDCRTKLMNRLDFNTFNDTVKENPSYNIAIDGRLEELVYYAILTCRDHVMIYSISDRTLCTIYHYISNTYKVRLSQLTLNVVRIWALILYIDRVCLNDVLGVHCSELLRYLTNNQTVANHLTFNYIIDNINAQSSGSINKRELKDIHDYMLRISNAFNSNQFIVKPLKTSLLNVYHIRLSMELMYSNKCVISL